MCGLDLSCTFIAEGSGPGSRGRSRLFSTIGWTWLDWLDCSAFENIILFTPWYQFPKTMICFVTSRFRTYVHGMMTNTRHRSTKYIQWMILLYLSTLARMTKIPDKNSRIHDKKVILILTRLVLLRICWYSDLNARLRKSDPCVLKQNFDLKRYFYTKIL